VAGGMKYEQLQPSSAGHLPSSAGGASLQPGGCSGGGADGSSNLTVTHLGPSFLAHRASCGTSSPTHPPSSLSPPPPAGLLNNKVKNKYSAAGDPHHMLATMYKPNNMGKLLGLSNYYKFRFCPPVKYLCIYTSSLERF